jgi:16S rRNA (guanine(966)-N(2))-methyltransferase RsmD
LKQPVGPGLRPTAARVKEALFSIIADLVPNAQVLDLYAGTGALGLEALSRGAREVMFVENQESSINVLRKNIQDCSLTECCTIIAEDVETFLTNPSSPYDTTTFDLVFADPPYEISNLESLLSKLDAAQRVTKNGVVVLEHFKKTSLPLQTGRLQQSRQSRYGDTMLSFYQLITPSNEDPCA